MNKPRIRKLQKFPNPYYYSFFFTTLILKLFFTTGLAAQQPTLDTLLRLEEVTVTASRSQHFSTGNQHLRLDSTQTFLLKNTNLAEVLSLNTSIFIKNYGPGRLATTSLRGGSASHTAVVWNGFNLENNMLGQTDFALLPSLFVDEVSVQYGNTSALWGSGAIGGAILLNSQTAKQNGWQLEGHSQIGSFQHFNNGGILKYKNKNFQSITKAFLETAKNDFPIEKNDGTSLRLPHSELQQSGFLQENYIHLHQRHQLGIHIWYQNVDRALPPNLSQTFSDAVQKDSIRRLSLDWKYVGDVLQWKARTGYFIEKLDYSDPNAEIFSWSSSQKWINEAEGFYELHPQHRFNFGLNYSRLTAQSTGYRQHVQQNRWALFAAHHWQSVDAKMKTTLNVHQAWADGAIVPFVVSGGFEYAFHPHWQWSGNVSRSYRLPTFNDLYWAQGGNPDVLAEQGWSQALTLQYQTGVATRNLNATLTFYNKAIDNWIIWLPLGNYYSPQNLLKVWSRGLEQRWTWQWQKTDWSGQIQAHYQLTFSTNQKAKTAQDVTLGKQLIYVPLHQGGLTFQLNYQTWRLQYYQSLQGKVYTLADNSDSLAGFYLSHVHLSKSLTLFKTKTNLFFKINNMWNKKYQVIANYPMPGRYFEGGVVFLIES